MELKNAITVEKAITRFNPDYWKYITSVQSYPNVDAVIPKITKMWRVVDGENYVWVDGNNEKDALERYITALDDITRKSTGRINHEILKMIARVYVRYRLNHELVTSFDFKEGQGHASYNRVRNSMRFVPDFYRRFGVVRFGNKLIPEFHKTCVHEYGHMLWHHWLSDDEKSKFKGVIPTFVKSPDPIVGFWRPQISTITGEVVQSEYLVPNGIKFIDQQELISPKECFAESFAMYVIDPQFFENLLPERSRYFQEVIDTDYKLISSKEVKKATVEMNGEKRELTDLVPVDLQTTNQRALLASKFEDALKGVLQQNGTPFRAVRQVITFGEFSSNKRSPNQLKAVVLLDGFPQSGFAYKGEEVSFRVLGDESEFNRIAHAELEAGDEKMYREIEKRYLRPEEIERWVTTKSGKRVPIPKAGVRRHRPHVSQLLSSERPKALPAPKLRVGALKPLRPVLTRYAIQEHNAERAGRHYDFRIQVGKKALSWVIPKGLPKAGQKRLAITQPTHSAAYMNFSGEIKSGYGKGLVQVREAGPIEIKRFDDNSIIFDILTGPSKGSYGMKKFKGKWVVQRVRKKEFSGQYRMKDYRMKPKKRMLTSTRYAIKPRIGGPKVLLYIGSHENRILTRTESSNKKRKGYAEKTDNFPYIRDLHLGAPGTVLEVEAFVHSPMISNAVLSSDSHHSRIIQSKAGKPVFLVHDILSAEGNDVRSLPYTTRMKLLSKTVPNVPFLKKVPGIVKNKKKVIRQLFDKGYHGVYVVDRKAAYSDGAGLYLSRARVKRSEVADLNRDDTDSDNIVVTSTGKRVL